MARPVKGTQLNGYTLERLMARGGMGEVYEATENKLQRRVALKVIAPPNPEEHDGDELIKRFLLEARTLAQLNHPNIVTIYSIDSVGGVPFIAMEYIEGVSFRDLLEEFVFSTDGALPLFLQMLEGLRCLHDNRIIHRDLKPHNILLRPDGAVKILDFGIAKHQGGTAATELTRVGVVVGTLPYMPPEVKSGVPASARSDIWSLGAIFYECLTGERLVTALQDEPNAKDVPFTPEQRKKIPSEMRQLINRMCAPRPSDRHSGVAEVIDELQRIQRKRPQVASQIWLNLAKKVEEVALAKKRESSTSALSARVAQLVEIANSHTPSPTPVIRESHARINNEATEIHRISPPRGSKSPNPLMIGGILVALAAVFFIAKGRQKDLLGGESPTPATPTPVVAQPVALADATRPLLLQEPGDNQMLWLEPARIPTLSWSRLLNPGEYDVQIASDPGFQKIQVQEPAIGGSFRPARVLAEGLYYWRLWGHGGKRVPVGPARFTISLLAPVELVQPDTDHSFDMKTGKTMDITFSWRCKPGAKRYRLQIAPDESFAALAQDLAVNSCQVTTTKLPEGDYVWRVRMDDVPAAVALWSEARGFTVTSSSPTHRPLPVAATSSPRPRPHASVLTLAEPKLREPKIAVKLSLKKKPRDLASLPHVIEEAPDLNWTAVAGAKGYLVQFSTSKDFVNLLSEERVTTPHLEWRNVVPGRVYWRVAATGRESERGNFSGHGLIDVMLPPPEVAAVYNLQAPFAEGEEQDPVPIEWQNAPLAEKYIVQFSKRRDLASAQERVVTNPKLAIDPVAGTYYMRVAAADSAGQQISTFSSLSTIQIEAPAPAVEGPQLLSPRSGAHAVSRSGRISILFSWSKVESADLYMMEIASDPEFKEILDRRSTKDRGTLLKQMEFKGRVFWRVRAKGSQGLTGWSKPSFFELK